jgi:hypothetical protein
MEYLLNFTVLYIFPHSFPEIVNINLLQIIVNKANQEEKCPLLCPCESFC